MTSFGDWVSRPEAPYASRAGQRGSKVKRFSGRTVQTARSQWEARTGSYFGVEYVQIQGAVVSPSRGRGGSGVGVDGLVSTSCRRVVVVRAEVKEQKLVPGSVGAHQPGLRR